MTDIQKEGQEVSQRYKKLSPFNMLLFNAVIECGLAIANSPNGTSGMFLSLIAAMPNVNTIQQTKKTEQK